MWRSFMELGSKFLANVRIEGKHLESYYGLSVGDVSVFAAVHERCSVADYETVSLFPDVPGADLVFCAARIGGETHYVTSKDMEEVCGCDYDVLLVGGGISRGAKKVLEDGLEACRKDLVRLAS